MLFRRSAYVSYIKFNVSLVEPTPISYIFTLIERESYENEILSFPKKGYWGKRSTIEKINDGPIS